MSFHSELAGRLADLYDTTQPDQSVEVWAVRAAGAISSIVGNENITIDEIRQAFETLIIMAPDETLQALNRVNLILFEEKNK